MRYLRRAWLVNACAFLLLAATQSSAQFKPKVNVEVPPNLPIGPAIIQINDRTAVLLITSNGALAPADRARLAASRLQALIAAGADRKKIKAKAISQGRADIMWGQTLVLIVTKSEADAHASSVFSLATTWAGNIRWLLAAPPLTLSPASLVVPLGETRQALVGGGAQGIVYVSDSLPDIATTTVSQNNCALTVKGLAPGTTTVSVTRGGVTVPLNVSVRKYAGRVATPRTVMVTGSPAPSMLCSRLAELEASRSLVLEPGARATTLPPTTKVPDLPGASQFTLTFPVRIEGPGYISVGSSANVRVMNAPLPSKPTGKLFYSNSPEKVEKYGVLFAGKLHLDDPTRLLYHHQNMLGSPFIFNIVLVNSGPAPARVQIIKAMPDPIVDTVAVGYRAGVEFFRAYLNNVGEIADLPPMSKTAVLSQIVDKIHTTSGIAQFRQLEGYPLLIKLSADLVENGVFPDGEALEANSADAQLALSPWVYPYPTKPVDAEYIVGKSWAFIRIGKYAIKDAAQEQLLYGNYGVIYDINLTMRNPASERKQVDVLFKPGAGMASGVFTIDGKYVKVTHIEPPREVSLARYLLEPGQSKTVSIKTTPLAGSFYPATILVRS